MTYTSHESYKFVLLTFCLFCPLSNKIVESFFRIGQTGQKYFLFGDQILMKITFVSLEMARLCPYLWSWLVFAIKITDYFYQSLLYIIERHFFLFQFLTAQKQIIG
jgi:hypothetical protein